MFPCIRTLVVVHIWRRRQDIFGVVMEPWVNRLRQRGWRRIANFGGTFRRHRISLRAGRAGVFHEACETHIQKLLDYC
jgi:hypothetical protein